MPDLMLTESAKERVLETEAPDVSVVVYVDEHLSDAVGLYRETAGVLKACGRTFEFLFVDDGTDPGVFAQLEDLSRWVRHVRAVRLPRTFGSSTAMSIGFEKARGRLILTLGPFLQVEPASIGRMFELLEEGYDFVNGWRVKRTDFFLNRLESWGYNALVRWVSKVPLHDSNCTVKLFRREVAQELAVYGDYYRFIPILAARRGFRVAEAVLKHRAESNATGIYHPGVFMRRALDLLALLFIGRFTQKPLRFFGLVGSALFLAGMAVNTHLAWIKYVYGEGISGRPLLLLGMLLMVLGLQTASVGLIGELIIFTHHKGIQDYRIERVIE
ncbi:MAG: glycosyltransferase [Candidatus Omnitrophica bacterium]|nr:glycosyltransferase [Candidatus Omnitrophota bacterium]